jgi:hypothetical protein
LLLMWKKGMDRRPVHAILPDAKGISNRTVAALALKGLWVFRRE